MDRAEVIAILLERYYELVEPFNGPTGVRGSGDRIPMMPETYTRSVRQLEVELRDMRERPQPLPMFRQHALDYYMNAQRIRREAFIVVHRSGLTAPCVDGQGLPRPSRPGERLLRDATGIPVKRPILCTVRLPARKDYADAACRYLARRFPFEPQLPRAIAA